MDTVHISKRVDACGKGFIRLAESLSNETYAAQVNPDAVSDQFDRFKIWAGNVAAHRKGRRSLEYRLRDSDHLRSEVHNVLKELENSLYDAHSIISGVRVPRDEQSNSDSDSDANPDTQSSSKDEEVSLKDDTELKQLYFSIKSFITRLFRLSMVIREPAPDSQNRNTLTVDKSYFEEYDVSHVKTKFERSDYLTERLGKAISVRRQYLAYREQHHQKLTKHIEKIGHGEPRTEYTTNSTEATQMKSENPDGTGPLAVVDDEDTLSQTSYATSVNTTIRTPALPREGRNQEFFECPLCYMIVSMHTKSAWKKHVYRDIHPYSCTFEQCTTADRLYDSRSAWWKHELEAHRSSYQCIEGCNKQFDSEVGLTTHVYLKHPELADTNLLNALIRTASRSASLKTRVACQLCSAEMALRDLGKHLGHHQEQLALFALPPNLEQADHESQSEDSEQEEVVSESDESLAGDSEGIPTLIEWEGSGNRVYVTGTFAQWKRKFKLRPNVPSQKKDVLSTIVNIKPGTHQLKFIVDGNWTTSDTMPIAVDYANNIVNHIKVSLNDVPNTASKSISENASSPDFTGGENHKDTVSDNHDQIIHSEDETGMDIIETNALVEVEAAKAELEEDFTARKTTDENAIAEAKAATEDLEKLKKSPAEEKTIKFKDAIGRKFSFQWHICKTWKGIEGLIKQAFPLNVDVPRSYVHEGHYDLVGPDGRITPQVWETVVQPGWEITMHMWPTPERPHAPKLDREDDEHLGDQTYEAIEGDIEANKLGNFQFERKTLLLSQQTAHIEKEKEHDKAQDTTAEVKGYDDQLTEQEAPILTRKAEQLKREEASETTAHDAGMEVDRTTENKAGTEHEAAIDAYSIIREKEETRGFVLEEEQQGAQRLREQEDERSRIILETENKLINREEERKRILLEEEQGTANLTKETKEGKRTKEELEEYERFLQEQRQQAREDEESQEQEFEEQMRKRLAQFGFQDDQIQAMIKQDNNHDQNDLQPGVTQPSRLPPAEQPTYVKVSKEHLEIDTLIYYDLPYEVDTTDPNYLIILRKMDAKETEILFEHTRRLRNRTADRLLIEEQNVSGKPEYAWVRRRKTRRNSDVGSSTATVPAQPTFGDSDQTKGEIPGRLPVIDSGNDAADGRAGGETATEVEKISQKWEQKLEEIRKELGEAIQNRDNEAKEELRKYKEDVEIKIAQGQDSLSQLQADRDKLHQEMKEKYEKELKEMPERIAEMNKTHSTHGHSELDIDNQEEHGGDDSQDVQLMEPSEGTRAPSGTKVYEDPFSQTPNRFLEGDSVAMLVVNGTPVKGNFTVRRTRYNPAGFWEYQLRDDIGNYNNGAWVRECQLKMN